MSSSQKLLTLFAVSVVALMLCEGAAWASLTTLALPEFVAEQPDDSSDMASDSSEPDNPAGDPLDEPVNPIRLTARKGLVYSSSSSSSPGSSSAPVSGASGSWLSGIAIDHEALSHDEQSEWLYADTIIFIPSAVQSRLFRPPRLS